MVCDTMNPSELTVAIDSSIHCCLCFDTVSARESMISTMGLLCPNCAAIEGNSLSLQRFGSGWIDLEGLESLFDSHLRVGGHKKSSDSFMFWPRPRDPIIGY